MHKKSAKGNNYAYCTLCDIDISNKGKGDFIKHTETVKHKLIIISASTSKNLEAVS